jgi:HAD superfamily hydrolase (TIGR01490 family)
MRWAIFDVDGTLFPRPSMEKKFIVYMLRKGSLPIKNMSHYLLIGIFKTLQRNYNEGFRSNKYYLKHLPARSIQSEALKFVQREIWPTISQKGIHRIKSCRKKGLKILIMSGSPDFLAQPLTDFIHPDYIISSEMEIRNDFFTGRLEGLHPYGQRKAEILQRLHTQLDIDLQNSIVFANHHSDVPHMLLFGEAIAVNPTKKLGEFARKNHWKIEQWH